MKRKIILVFLSIGLTLALVIPTWGTETDSKYFTPRKIRPEEQPRETRSKNLENARLQLMKNYDKLMNLMKELEPEINIHNQKLEARFNKELQTAVEKAKWEGRQFSWEERRKMEEERFFSYRYAYHEAYYNLLQLEITLLGLCQPDIDDVSPFSIRPGRGLVLRGTCFGPSQGKVLIEISSGSVVELEVSVWEETHVDAKLNRLIAGVPLRPYYGKVWLQRGDGETSNVWPIMYYPVYSFYIASWTKHVGGGLFGKSIDATFLRNRMLGDSDFTIERVDRQHSFDGWSELRTPTAGGQSLGQGYHIGVAAFGYARMTLKYIVKGPKGIDPPYVDELGPWGWDGDVSY